MLFLIEKLQRKPERQKKQLAFFASVAITGIIVLLWLSSFSAVKTGPVPESEQTTSPLSTLTEAFGSFWRDTTGVLHEATTFFSVFGRSPEPPAEGGLDEGD